MNFKPAVPNEDFVEATVQTFVENGVEHTQVDHINEKAKEVIMNVEAHNDYQQAAILIKRKHKQKFLCS